MNIFEYATKNKIRFNMTASAGVYNNLTTEDLWDIPLTSTNKLCLDGIAKQINQQIKASEEESFVTPVSSGNTELNIKLDIVKHVIAVRLQEKQQKEQREQRKQERQRISELLAQKQEQALSQKSTEELQALLESLKD